MCDLLGRGEVDQVVLDIGLRAAAAARSGRQAERVSLLTDCGTVPNPERVNGCGCVGFGRSSRVDHHSHHSHHHRSTGVHDFTPHHGTVQYQARPSTVRTVNLLLPPSPVGRALVSPRNRPVLIRESNYRESNYTICPVRGSLISAPIICPVRGFIRAS